MVMVTKEHPERRSGEKNCGEQVSNTVGDNTVGGIRHNLRWPTSASLSPKTGHTTATLQPFTNVVWCRM